MRLLYVGILKDGSTSLQRMRAMQDLGHEMQPFDASPFDRVGSRVERAVAYRLAWGRAITRLNKQLTSFAKGWRCDWVWIEKGVWVYPETLEYLRKQTGGILVHYTPDPAIWFHQTRHFMRCLPLYDVCVTSKRFEVATYREKGARRVILLPQGFDPSIFRPREIPADRAKSLSSDVCFVGRFERHYGECLRAAHEAAPNVAIWGRWRRHIRRHPWIRNVLRADGVWGHEYAEAMCCAKIGLGLLSKWIPETSTTRTFEIPACGTFLLAERTDEHAELFEEGREAEFFASLDELRDKIRFFLAHDSERRRIGAAGRERCLKSGYTYKDRLKLCIEAIGRGDG